MDKEIIEAMKVIQGECNKNRTCGSCIFYDENRNDTCKLHNNNPAIWDIPEQQEEIDVQGIEEIEVDENGFLQTNLGAFKGRKIDLAFNNKLNKIIKALKQLDKTTIKVKVEEK